MNADEVYRYIVVEMARNGMVSPHFEKLPIDREFSEDEARQLANEAVDFLDAKLKHMN